MMKTILTAAVAMTALLAAGAAHAADPNTKQRPMVTPVYPAAIADYGFNWTGAYVGANIGYRWAEADVSAGGLTTTAKPANLIGGIALGYNMQAGNIVYGVETDLDFGKSSKSGLVGGTAFTTSHNWEGTTRARLGVALDKALIYGTAGLAYAEFDNTYNAVSAKKWDFGWTAGAGVEYALTKNVSMKAEYLYADYGKQTVNGASFSHDDHRVRAGINFRF